MSEKKENVVVTSNSQPVLIPLYELSKDEIQALPKIAVQLIKPNQKSISKYGQYRYTATLTFNAYVHVSVNLKETSFMNYCLASGINPEIVNGSIKATGYVRASKGTRNDGTPYYLIECYLSKKCVIKTFLYDDQAEFVGKTFTFVDRPEKDLTEEDSQTILD